MRLEAALVALERERRAHEALRRARKREEEEMTEDGDMWELSNNGSSDDDELQWSCAGTRPRGRPGRAFRTNTFESIIKHG
eukprot:8683641-Pyramimonas_sp.AAC.1